MAEIAQCSNCSEEVTDDSDFCPHCGELFDGVKNVFCDEHTQNSAQGVCIICQRLVCFECGVRSYSRIFCQAHRRVEVQEDWAEVFRSTDVGDAEMIKSLLESTGHKVLDFNLGPKGLIWEGDTPLWRSNVNKPAKIFVPIPEYLQAMEVVYDWRSSQIMNHPDEPGM